MKNPILLVGTQFSGLTYIGLLLEQAGYTTTKCRDFEHVSELLEKQPCALIIIDDQQPTLDAVTFCQKVRRRPTIASVPILLLLPVNEDVNAPVSSADCGANILTKPILPHLLIEKVSMILGESELAQ